ncbi:Brain chitinase and chia [Operophtera brumata]|uniref:Brain chitinase and chia n=1 Tax=Operophtera brumata TaxID=104452 RepID=A0A0L7L8Z6_OPEBR|nr:Brain chitinase and chia [Operophtera brumata]
MKALSSEPRVVCYYTNWSVYRPGTARFNPQNINPYLCTHLIYAFGGFTKDNTLKPFDKYQDIEKGIQNRFDGLDLDWEYPAFRDGGKPKDRENYARLVKELRKEFEREAEKTNKPRLLLTMAVPAGIEDRQNSKL